MIRKRVFDRLFQVKLISTRHQSERSIDIKKLEEENVSVGVIDDESSLKEEEIERKRNKSRLKPADYNLLHDRPPYPQPALWTHGTVKYVRKMYGRYGEVSGVNPSICWPTKKELEDKIEYERVAFPFTIPGMIETAKVEKQKILDRIWERQEEVVKKVAKVEQWKKELHDKVAKKEEDAMKAKHRKDRLIEEVRRHFGYTVDPKDEKFKDMLEKKEKEQKKVLKEARKKEKEEKMIAKLLSKKSSETPPDNETTVS